MARITSNTTIGPFEWNGGGVDLAAVGTFDSATVTFKWTSELSVTPITLGSLTAPGHLNDNIGIGHITIEVTGGGGSLDLYAQAYPSEGALGAGSINLSVDNIDMNLEDVEENIGNRITPEAGSVNDRLSDIDASSFGENGVTHIGTGFGTLTSQAVRGLQVIEDVTAAADFIVGGTVNLADPTSLDGAVLKIGYHPLIGDASVTWDFTGTAGQAYFIHE